MLMNVTFSAAEQWIEEDLCELKADFDDADEDLKKEKEKVIYTVSLSHFFIENTVDFQFLKKAISIKKEKSTSQLFCFLPELPPELECGFQPA